MDIDGGAVMLYNAIPTPILQGTTALSEFVILIILSIGMLTISWYAMKTASLENDGRFLMNNKFRVPILIIGSLYVTICLSGHYASFNYDQLIPTGQVISLIIKIILILVASVIAFGCSCTNGRRYGNIKKDRELRNQFSVFFKYDLEQIFSFL